VSWVRQRDLHILTVGRYTYTSDQRFTCIHLDNTDDWTLEIKYVQKEDAGVYECQISTEPKMSYSIKLQVVAAKATIPEGPDVFVRAGSTVNLTCVITESTSPPVYVFWYRDGTVINYDSPRRGIRVTTDKGPTAVSRLQISKVKPTDAGDYSCKPSYADFANVTIHVTNGEKSEAMHHGHQNVSNLSIVHAAPTGSSIYFI
ncbi:Down syndrome cell adhesion molecule-like protein, partial [Dinothrombium tinctorium]